MLDNLTFSQRRVHTVGVGVLLSGVMLCTPPVFAQELRHVAEVLKETSIGPASFGPVGALCNAPTGGPECKFLDRSASGTGKIVEGGDDTGGRFTYTQTNGVLFVSTPSGSHDASGAPTGLCFPVFGTDHWVFEDGSTIDLNRQGSVCCAASSCPPPRMLQPAVFHISTIITGGTSRFAGLKGGGERASAPGIIIEEQVWELPSAPEN